MVPVIVDPRSVKAFATAAAFERWLSTHHATETELWLKIHKKASGRKSITYAEALDVALCWGWIDGLKKSFDADSFIQRFSPRRPRSVWSQVNREHVARLVKAGRMTEHGQRHVDAARADGRWEAAYAPIREASTSSIPPDLMAAITANTRALATFKTLGKMNLFALAFRTNAMKTAAGRSRKIATLVAMLADGQTIVPERAKKG
ncbi:MAG: YdeI/OmpD-associated family protein [Gemmatimonadota bacterium]